MADTTTDWHDIHAQLTSIAKRKAEIDAEELPWLLAAEEARVHEKLGHGSLSAYLGAVLGYSEREARERLLVARRLQDLPEITSALVEGRLVWTGARELSRVATSETEGDWLEATADKSVRQIEKMVSGLSPGDLPDDPKEQEAERHVLRFEVDGATYATWREAVKKVRAETGGNLSEEEALLTIARIALEGPNNEGRANYQIAVTVCDMCDQATQDGRGEAIVISEEARDMASCDAQFIGNPATHVGQNQRATQSIPPAKRRAVVRRDHCLGAGGRVSQCVVDGCTAATFVDVHHLHWREDAGGHDVNTMACLCCGHHAAVHAGTLCIKGTPAEGMTFLHPDGTPFGSPRVDTRACARNTSQWAELKGLGLAADDAWRAVLSP